MMVRALWLALVACAAASPLQKRGQNIPIGFRAVGAAQALQYQQAGNTIVWQAARVQASSDQLGPGLYMSPSLGEWPGAADGWNCAVLADSNAFNNANKVYIPQVGATDTCAAPLWFAQGVPNRPNWLQTQGGPGYTTANTILVSEIEGFEPQIQFLIPPGLLTSSNPLGITVQCAAKSATLETQALADAYGTINWRGWQGLKAAP